MKNSSWKQNLYLFIATIFGAVFMFLAFKALQLGLLMLSLGWALTNEYLDKYIDGGIALFGAIIGYMNGLNWWTMLYDKNSALKEKYRGLSGMKLRLRMMLRFMREIE